MNRKSLKIIHDVNVAIKSYVISILIGSTFDGFIDCSNIVILCRTLMKILTSLTNQTVFKCRIPGRSNDKIENYTELSFLQCLVGMEFIFLPYWFSFCLESFLTLANPLMILVERSCQWVLEVLCRVGFFFCCHVLQWSNVS